MRTVAVVGAGVVGMSAAVALLDRDAEVSCYESGSIMGERSVGSTRIFRLAHVHPDLVRLAIQARQGFAGWTERTGRSVLIACECVITGFDIADRADAMAKAGADYEFTGAGASRLRLPLLAEPAAALVDVRGAVIDVDAVRDVLVARAGPVVRHDTVRSLHITSAGGAAITSNAGTDEYDSVIIAAGANTSHLAAQVGIFTPPLLSHHVRFTFPVDRNDLQAWIDKPSCGVGTYQHQAGRGLWAVGGHVDPSLTAWEVGREAAIEASRAALLDYVRANLTVKPRIVDSVYCTTVPNLGDGIEFRRNGPFLAIYGDNLIKFAPVLGTALAKAAVEGTTPTVAAMVA